MKAQRVRILIAAAAAVVVIGTIAVLFVYTSSLRPYEPIAPYSERYNPTIISINAGTGVYRERDYYVSNTREVASPSNGELLINPIQLPDGEEAVPRVQQSSYAVEDNADSALYTRLTNSKRSEERTGQMPEAAVLSLSYAKAAREGWHQLILYNVADPAEIVDSALIFSSSEAGSATNWEGRVSLYLIDGGLTNHAAAILPGVNILNSSDAEGHATGVIYTNRGLALGSLPTSSQDEAARDALEAAQEAGTLANDAVLGRNISQRITGTDLLFSAPEGRSVLSSIKAPVSTQGRENSLSVEGGVIAVDRGVTLVMGSGTVGSTNSLLGRSGPASGTVATTESAGPTEGSLALSPRALIVDGGTLVLSDTDSGKITLNTSIQVRNGGTLQIGENVIINGNIYVFGGGSVEVLGSFVLNGEPVAVAPSAKLTSAADVQALAQEAGSTAFGVGAQVPGGIYIFADSSLQPDGTPLGTGYFKASLLRMIDGSDGFDTIVRSRIVHFFSTEGFPGYPLLYSDYHCNDADATTSLCTHLGEVEGVLAPEVKVGFSEDMALVTVFVPQE
ncbi:MAG: hypothetical protein LBJ48_07580 [Coriobacteriales bacterium]|jgi:hypothetical protein|nr:hypothetical protein [Coriobacteriales bacterium]